MNRAFVDYVIRDYDKPLGVATYRTAKDMPDRLRQALPDAEVLKKLLETPEKTLRIEAENLLQSLKSFPFHFAGSTFLLILLYAIAI